MANGVTFVKIAQIPKPASGSETSLHRSRHKKRLETNCWLMLQNISHNAGEFTEKQEEKNNKAIWECERGKKKQGSQRKCALLKQLNTQVLWVYCTSELTFPLSNTPYWPPRYQFKGNFLNLSLLMRASFASGKDGRNIQQARSNTPLRLSPLVCLSRSEVRPQRLWLLPKSLLLLQSFSWISCFRGFSSFPIFYKSATRNLYDNFMKSYCTNMLISISANTVSL